MRLPRPTPKLAVAHSPTPSRVRIAASSKGEGKKALAAWRLVVLGEDAALGGTCRRGRGSSPAAGAASPASHSGMAMRNERKPRGA